MATNTPALLARYAPVVGSTSTQARISNKVITSNLATITTAAAHGITQVGTIVTIQGVDAIHDGTYAINSIPSGTTFTYVSTTATQSTTAVSPVGIAIFNTSTFSGFAVTNKVVQNYVATLTTAAHSFSVGDMVFVTLGDTIYDQTQAQIVAVPTTTTFSYIVTTQTAATTVISQGAVGKYGVAYTVPALTSTIVTNIVIANKSSSSQTYTICLDTNCIAFQQTIAANATTAIDLKQFLATTKTIMGSASSPLVNMQISGMTVA